VSGVTHYELGGKEDGITVRGDRGWTITWSCFVRRWSLQNGGSFGADSILRRSVKAWLQRIALTYLRELEGEGHVVGPEAFHSSFDDD